MNDTVHIKMEGKLLEFESGPQAVSEISKCGNRKINNVCETKNGSLGSLTSSNALLEDDDCKVC